MWLKTTIVKHNQVHTVQFALEFVVGANHQNMMDENMKQIDFLFK